MFRYKIMLQRNSKGKIMSRKTQKRENNKKGNGRKIGIYIP